MKWDGVFSFGLLTSTLHVLVFSSKHLFQLVNSLMISSKLLNYNGPENSSSNLTTAVGSCFSFLHLHTLLVSLGHSLFVDFWAKNIRIDLLEAFFCFGLFASKLQSAEANKV